MEYSEKFNLIVKPTQSGKTFVLLYEIKRLFKIQYEYESHIGKNMIHIFFCDNSLLQTDQLKSRIDDDVELSEIMDTTGELSAVLSSKSNITNYADLYTAIFDDECNNVITCANGSRIEQIHKLISKQLVKATNALFYIWIDESDKTFTDALKTTYLKKWNKMENIEKITFITATPDQHFKSQFKELNIFELDESHNGEIFHLFKDCEFIYTHHETKNVVENIQLTLESDAMLDQNGSVWFVPGTTQTASHAEIKQIMMDHGFYVFLLNGTDKGLYYQGKCIAFLDDDGTGVEELSKKLGDLYESHGLASHKVAITGNLCISRGITLSSEKMMITHAILPPIMTNHSAAYQLAGRLCGNSKLWSNFRVPTVYITENSYTIAKYSDKRNIKNVICNMERIACELSKYKKISAHEYFRLKENRWRTYYVRTGDLSSIHALLRPYFMWSDLYTKYKDLMDDGTDYKSFEKIMNKKFNKILKASFTASDFEHTSRTQPQLGSRDDAGFMRNLIRDKFEVMRTSDMGDDYHWGIDTKTIARFHVSYDDLSNISSVQYWIAFIDPLYVISTLYEKIQYEPSETTSSTTVSTAATSSATSTKTVKKKLVIQKKPAPAPQKVIYDFKVFESQDDLFAYYESTIRPKYPNGRKPSRKKASGNGYYLCNTSKRIHVVNREELMEKLDYFMENCDYKNLPFYMDKNDMSTLRFGFACKV